MAKNTFVLLILLSFFMSVPASLYGGNWGLERGRADFADVDVLRVTQNRMEMARNRIERAISDPLKQARQRQLLGLPTDNIQNAGQLLDGVYYWWMEEVMAPAQLIALNPAASCAEAKRSMSTLLGMMRDRQLLGLEDSVERSAEISRIYDATNEMVFQRCRDEALDECVVTGRFDQIISTALGQQRQTEMQGGSFNLDDWVDDSVKQCAIYELQFVSTMKNAQIFNLETVRRSKMEIKFDIPKGGVLNALKSLKKMSDLLKGETLDDVMLDSAKCSQPEVNVVCKAGRVLTQNKAAVVNLDMKHREYYIDASDVSTVRYGVGEDKFVFEFSGGIVGVDGEVIVPGYGTVPFPMPGIGYGFYIAHEKDRIDKKGDPNEGSIVKVDNNKRGGYPVLFEFTYTDQGGVNGGSVSDTTEFKLIHKPKPAALPPKEVRPIRKPLKPKPGGG